MIAKFYIGEGVAFTTEAGMKLLEKYGGCDSLPFKIVSKEDLEKLTAQGDGHVLSLSPASTARH